jgi:hypothetical protein
VTRWRGIVDTIAPHAAVEDPEWDKIWHRAAGGLAVGFDVDAALTVVAHQLTARPVMPDPMPDDRYADAALAAELERRSERGEAHQRAVPWLARPDFAHVRHHPGHAEYLHEMNNAIADRVEQLRAAVIRNQPEWAAGLGPRPDNPIAAEDWDDLVGLVAAYRETFRIEGAAPLGGKPGSHGARAHAWHALTEHWNAFSQAPVPVSSEPPPPRTTARVAELDDVFAAFDRHEERVVLEPLNVLIRRYELLARDGDEERYLDILARYVPDAVNAGAEPAALGALANAQDQGWQAERLVRKLADDSGFSWASDPAAVLAKRVSTHASEHRPPARIGAPTDEQVDRWRSIVAEHLPDAAVTDEQWDIVWRHAAGGTALGLDADTALTEAITRLGDGITGAGDGDYRRAGEALVAALTDHHRGGEGLHAALPWQAQPDFGTPGNHRGALERLDGLNGEIAARADQLHDQVHREQPQWAAQIGHRPDDSGQAASWNQTVRLAAAYRETYGITTTDAASPLGQRPTGHGPKAEAWDQITTQWRQLMTTPDPHDAASDAMLTVESRRDTLDALRDEFTSGVAARSEQLREEDERELRDALHEEAEDEYHDLRDSIGNDMHRGMGY